MIRIVKLTIKEEHLEDFIKDFNTFKDSVNTFPGCKGMRMLQDKNNPQTIFTYSQWESDEALDNYRHSELFGKVWPAFKRWFADRTEVWSTEMHYDGFKFH